MSFDSPISPATVINAPGLTVHYANGLDRLVEPLSEALRAERSDWRDALFMQPCIIVPNRNVATYLKLELARKMGASGALRFPYLESFLAEVVGKRPHPTPSRLVGREFKIAEEAHIQVGLISLLRSDPRMGDGTWAAPASYVNANGAAGDTRDQRIYQLATRLAHLFREYAYSRPALLQAWDEGKLLYRENSAYAETEKWQHDLWRALFGANGILGGNGWKLLHLAWQSVDFAPGGGEQNLALPRGVHIFGLSYVGQSILSVLEKLSAHTAVSIYSVNPCAEFWEDVPAGWRVSYRDTFSRRAARLPAARWETDDPFGLNTGADTPLLRAWGRPGREHIRLLNELSECNVEAHFPPGADEADTLAPTLLAQIQQDIMLRVPERAGGTRLQRQADASIQVLACPGVLREVEIIASQIWELIQADPTLRFDQIAVIVNPQSKDTYFPHLEAVFQRLHRIPYAIADRMIRGGARIAEAIELLLKLPLGNFSRSEMLRLMVHPNVIGRFRDALPEEWLNWGERLGILFGADAEAVRAETYVEEDLLNWDQGIRRLALGAFMAGEPSGIRQPYEFEARRCLPEEIEAGRNTSAGIFTALARSLLADAKACRDERPLAEWADYLAGMVRAYLYAEEDSDGNILNRCARDLQGLAELDLTGERVSYRIAAELALARISVVESPKGHYLADGVAVSTFLPMRAIPFRAVFLLGLSEGDFPAAEPNDPLDLRPAKRQAGDVSRREKDKYMFLETLLAAREKICFSYVARDAKTGDALAPSSVVQELLYLLKAGYLTEGQSIEVTHPLNRYAPEYFAEQKRLVSHDPAAAREAAVSALRAGVDGKLNGGMPPKWETWKAILDPAVAATIENELAFVQPPTVALSEVKNELSLAALRRFLDCPLQASARTALGLREDEDASILSVADEPFAADRLSLTMTLREVFLAGGTPEAMQAHLEDLLRLLELAGAFPTGVFAQVARQRAKTILEAWQHNAAQFGLPKRLRSVQFGRGERSAPVDLNAGVLVLASGMRLFGLCDPLAGPADRRFDTCVLLKTGEPREKDFLHGFLNSVYLTAQGLRDENESFQVIVLPGEPAQDPDAYVRKFKPFSRQAARDYLSNLATDATAGFQTDLLPVEAVLAFAAQGAEKPDSKAPTSLSEIVIKLTNTRASHSSLHGPIRDLSPFAPPEEAAGIRIVQRRFSLYLESMEEGAHA